MGKQYGGRQCRMTRQHAVPLQTFPHQLTVDEGVIRTGRFVQVLGKEHAILAALVYGHRIFDERQGLQVHESSRELLDEDGTKGLLVGSEIAAEGVGEKAPAKVYGASDRHENVQRRPLHKTPISDDPRELFVVGDEYSVVLHQLPLRTFCVLSPGSPF